MCRVQAASGVLIRVVVGHRPRHSTCQTLVEFNESTNTDVCWRRHHMFGRQNHHRDYGVFCASATRVQALCSCHFVSGERKLSAP